MSSTTTADGTQIYYKDWGDGQPVVFSHGWPLSSDSWESQMMHLASNGFRVIAHDRRGHYAGMIRAAANSSASPTGVPRVRGDDPRCSSASRAARVRSPRTRG